MNSLIRGGQDAATPEREDMPTISASGIIVSQLRTLESGGGGGQGPGMQLALRFATFFHYPELRLRILNLVVREVLFSVAGPV